MSVTGTVFTVTAPHDPGQVLTTIMPASGGGISQSGTPQHVPQVPPLSLPPGVWEVDGLATFIPQNGSAVQVRLWLSTSSTALVWPAPFPLIAPLGQGTPGPGPALGTGWCRGWINGANGGQSVYLWAQQANPCNMAGGVDTTGSIQTGMVGRLLIGAPA